MMLSISLLSLSSVLGLSTDASAHLMTPTEIGVDHKILAVPYALSPKGFEKASQDATPERLARAFLSRESEKLGIPKDLADLNFHSIQVTPVGSIVRFEQSVRGAPVESADLVVTVDQGEVVSFINNYGKIEADTFQKKTNPPPYSLSKEWAIKKAYEELSLTASPQFESIEEKNYIEEGVIRPVYVIQISAPVDHLYGWKMVIDGDSGKIIQSNNMVLDLKPKWGAPKVHTSVFNPNPTIKSGMAYGSVPGYKNDNNSDSPFFQSMMTSIELDHLTVSKGRISLTGPNVTIEDLEAPTNTDCSVSSDLTNWNYSRSHPCFPAVSAYYFIDKSIRYLNEQLGFNAHPIRYSGGVKADPNGVSGDDNSHYNSTLDVLAFGTGGVPDAEDHDVVMHELGHAIHNWLTHGHLSRVEGLSEGIGDYWAASYDRQFMKPGHVAYHWTYSFDGHNEFWDGRVVNVTSKYPEGARGANSNIYVAGQLWATVCMEIYDAIGKEKADRLFWSGISMLSDNSNQEDAAKAYVAATRRIYPNDKKLIETVVFKFKARGYQVN